MHVSRLRLGLHTFSFHGKMRDNEDAVIRPEQPRDQTNEKKKRGERLAGTTVDLLMGRAASRFVPLPHTHVRITVARVYGRF